MTPAEQCKAAGHKCCAISVVRFVLGVIFFMHGGQKVMGWFGGKGLTDTVQMMSGMGLPVVLVYLVAFGEFLGGIALMVGFLSRLAALGIAIIMAGAVVTVHWKNGFFLQNQGYEYNLALISMCLAVLMAGGGCLSIDRFFCKDKDGR